jgi:hypothetical protein
MNFIQELRANPLVTHFAAADRDNFKKKAAIAASTVIVIVNAIGAYLVNISPQDPILLLPVLYFRNWADVAFSGASQLFFAIYGPYLAAASASWTAGVFASEEFQTLRITLVTPRQIAVGLIYSALYQRRLAIVLGFSMFSTSVFQSIGILMLPDPIYAENIGILIPADVVSILTGILIVASRTLFAVGLGTFTVFIFRNSTFTVTLATAAAMAADFIRFVVEMIYTSVFGFWASLQARDGSDYIRTILIASAVFYSITALIWILTYLGLTQLIVRYAEERAERL